MIGYFQGFNVQYAKSLFCFRKYPFAGN